MAKSLLCCVYMYLAVEIVEGFIAYITAIMCMHNLVYFAETFCVAHQSKGVVLKTPRAVVPLFCIASSHNSLLSYRWSNLHGDVGLLSPVYYAHKSGVYKCTVDDGFGSKCYSKSIEVTDGKLIL